MVTILRFTPYSFEALEQIVHFKPQVKSASIIHDGNRQVYKSLHGDYLAANDAERPSFLVLIKDFVHQELFEISLLTFTKDLPPGWPPMWDLSCSSIEIVFNRAKQMQSNDQ